MNIIIDSDQELDYEINSSYRKLFNFFFVPILNALPPQSRKLIQKSHESVSEVVEKATTHNALEVLYKKGHKHHTTTLKQKLSHWVWFNTNNSKAVRNRILLVERELKKAINKLYGQGKNVAILSIASGSARAIIESIDKIQIPKGKKISVVFIDKNPEALKYSDQLLKEYGLRNDDVHTFTWVNGTAGSFLRDSAKNRFNVIEMVGLLDYFNNEKAVSIFNNIRNVLEEHGIFITANIDRNSEERFVTHAIGWKMEYRSAKELGTLLLKSGFREHQIKLYYEPLKIHGVAVVTKD